MTDRSEQAEWAQRLLEAEVVDAALELLTTAREPESVLELD